MTFFRTPSNWSLSDKSSSLACSPDRKSCGDSLVAVVPLNSAIFLAMKSALLSGLSILCLQVYKTQENFSDVYMDNTTSTATTVWSPADITGMVNLVLTFICVVINLHQSYSHRHFHSECFNICSLDSDKTDPKPNLVVKP